MAAPAIALEAASAGGGTDLTSSDVQPSVVPLRLCITCKEPIPTNRLAARPNASQCVPCLTAAGDVVKTKRYDEVIGEEIVSTYFRTNRRIEERIARLGMHVPSTRILVEETESPTIGINRPEQAADQRAADTKWLYNEAEENPLE
jgi:hypothetical protein